MHKFSLIRILPTLLLACFWSALASAQSTPLRFGVFPNLSTRVLLEVHQPLADYLSHALKRPVYLETAPDFARFVRRTAEGRYDLLLTAPHLAYLAHSEAGYEPLYAYSNPVQGVLVVRKDAPFRALKDLKGATIAMADPLAVVVMMMEADLNRAGLLEGRDFTRLEARSHNNAALLVVQGKAQGGVLGTLPLQHLPVEIRQKLRALAYTRPMLSQIYLANPRLSAADVEGLKVALEAYAKSAAGQEFFRQGGLGGLAAVSSGALQELDRYGREAARRLGSAVGP